MVPGTLAFRLVHTLPVEAQVFGIGGALIACEGGCSAGAGEAAPRTWLITAEHVREDASLWPPGLGKESDLYSQGGDSIYYFGAYPGAFFAVRQRGASRIGSRYVFRRRGIGWEKAPRRDARVDGLPEPVEYAEALAHTPFLPGYRQQIHGGGGPLMIGEGKLARWTGARWRTVAAPWGARVSGIRLTTGVTLALSEAGLFGIDASGAIAPVPIEPDVAARSRRGPRVVAGRGRARPLAGDHAGLAHATVRAGRPIRGDAVRPRRHDGRRENDE